MIDGDRPVPVWLLDIDGVVNALARGRVRDAWPLDAWVQRVVRADIPGQGAMVLPILAARPVLDFVTDVVRGVGGPRCAGTRPGVRPR